MTKLYIFIIFLLVYKPSEAQITVNANSVIGFSTEYTSSPGIWSAAQALGAPNTTSCGDITTAWASATTDSRREFLVLGIPTVLSANKIEIFETWNPGAIDTVYVRNAISGAWIEVFRTTAAANPTCPTSKIINFTALPYSINGIRIAMNSPVVPSWNEIDAIAVTAASIVLPLRLIDFSVKENDNNVHIRWKTDNEVNASHFDIETSSNGIVFKKNVAIASKKILGVNNYELFDNDVIDAGIKYYRIKMVDNDGQFTYSNILKLYKKGKVGIYPNPTSDIFNLTGIEKVNQIEILDTRGVVVMSRTVKNLNAISFKVNPQWKGIYIVRLIEEQNVNVYKINIQ